MAWTGRKKIAFVPLSRVNAHPPDVIPPDWENDILRRVLYDPDPNTGKDRPLRTYIHTVSSGLSVIGLGGWQQMKFLFDGGGGIIYAVPQ